MSSQFFFITKLPPIPFAIYRYLLFQDMIEWNLSRTINTISSLLDALEADDLLVSRE